jgi:hypothetical protein
MFLWQFFTMVIPILETEEGRLEEWARERAKILMVWLRHQNVIISFIFDVISFAPLIPLMSDLSKTMQALVQQGSFDLYAGL